MTKKKKGKRRNASGGGWPRVPRPARPRNGPGGRSKNEAVEAAKALASSVAGGFVASLLAGAAVGAGVKPTTAAFVTLAGGSVAAIGLDGNPRAAAMGAASAASGQLALGWQVRQAAIKAEEKRKTEGLAANTAPALPAATAPAPGAKRNGFEDEDADDYRNAGQVDDFAEDDEYVQVG